MPPPDEIWPKVYGELRRLAADRLAKGADGRSPDATAPVHEANLRLGEAAFADRSGFFRAAAVAMRRILVGHARRRKAEKRGGGVRALALNAARGRLERKDASSAEVARQRRFGRLSIDEAAEVLGVSRATAFRVWAYARALAGDGAGGGWVRARGSDQSPSKGRCPKPQARLRQVEGSRRP